MGKEIGECFAYKEIRGLQEGMRIFEENHPTRTFIGLSNLSTAWIHQSTAAKLEFIRLQLSYLEAAHIDVRRCGLVCLSHLVQGRDSRCVANLRCLRRSCQCRTSTTLDQ